MAATQRNAGQRAAAILLAALAQGILIALYILPHVQEARRESATPSSLVFVQQLDKPQVAPPPPASRNGDRSSSIAHAPPPLIVERGIASEPAPAAITLPQTEVPRID